MILNIISIVVTLVSMAITIYYTKKSKQYKAEIYAKIQYLDIKDFLNRFTQISIELSRQHKATNNNRGGKLTSLFDRINETMGYVPQFTTKLENKFISDELNKKMKDVNRFIICNRTQSTVEIEILYGLIYEMDVKMQEELSLLLEKMK